MARGKAITPEEEQVIRLGLQRGRPVSQIAQFLGRAPASIYKRIERMKQDGTIDQLELDMGQLDD